MTVTQEAPVTVLGRLLKHALGTFSLSLTKGDRHNLDVFFISETLELLSGVNTRSHDEDNRSLRGRLFIDLLDGGRLSAGEVSSLEVGVHEVNDRESNSVGSEASEDDHLFHVIVTLALPFSRKLSLLRVRFGGREPAEPLFGIELDSGSEALVEVHLLLKLAAVIPSGVSNPVGVWWSNSLSSSIEDSSSSKEELVLFGINEAISRHEFSAHLEGEQ